MADDTNSLEKTFSYLKQQRDELKLQMHLAEMDAKQEYDKWSEKFDQLTAEYAPVKDAVDASADNVLAAMSLTANEIKEGFQRVWNSLKDQK